MFKSTSKSHKSSSRIISWKSVISFMFKTIKIAWKLPIFRFIPRWNTCFLISPWSLHQGIWFVTRSSPNVGGHHWKGHGFHHPKKVTSKIGRLTLFHEILIGSGSRILFSYLFHCFWNNPWLKLALKKTTANHQLGFFFGTKTSAPQKFKPCNFHLDQGIKAFHATIAGLSDS